MMARPGFGVEIAQHRLQEFAVPCRESVINDKSFSFQQGLAEGLAEGQGAIPELFCCSRSKEALGHCKHHGLRTAEGAFHDVEFASKPTYAVLTVTIGHKRAIRVSFVMMPQC